MILTEDKTYTISLEQEDCGSTTGLVNKNTELVFSNKELLHAVVTCGMPIQRMTASFLSKKKLELTYKMFLVETALDTEGDRLKKAKRIAYLDSSEKSVMSYYMGMFLTKLISGRLYGADYLTHLNLISSIDFLKQLLALAKDLLEEEKKKDEPQDKRAQARAALTDLFQSIKTEDTPIIVEQVVNDIDNEVVNIVRQFNDAFQSVTARREIKKKLRAILWVKYQIKDNDVFERAYQYIEMYY